jgi:Lrp/AsnC family transcriptional regulator for asnA, asnC and gidA
MNLAQTPRHSPNIAVAFLSCNYSRCHLLFPTYTLAIVIEQNPGRFSLDSIDEAIVTLLQNDGRCSYGAIGRAVGLSEAAARQRVNRLRDSGVMRIVAITDPLQLGRGVVGTLGIRVSGDTRVVATRLAQVDAIEYVVITAGSYDLLAEIVCASEEELLTVINEQVRSIAAVRETETFMHLRTEKNVFTSGQRLSNRKPHAAPSNTAALTGADADNKGKPPGPHSSIPTRKRTTRPTSS